MKNLFFFMTVMLLFSCSSEKEKELILACSSNTRFVMEELIAQYPKEKGLKIRAVYASSGKLTSQILNGAPFHLFFSADIRYPRKIHEENYSLNAPQVYARGKLALWSETFSIKELSAKEALLHDSAKKIVIANPSTAPYGRAAMQVLNKTGLKQKISKKLVFAHSIGQTNHYISTKAADIGITALSAVKAPEINTNNFIPLADTLHSSINQGMVMLRHEAGMDGYKRSFYQYIRSEKAANIFENYGYQINDE